MRSLRLNHRLLLTLTLVLFGVFAVAQPASAPAQSAPIQLPNVGINLGGTKGSNDLSSSLQILALLTVLSIAPALMILTTAFTRIVIIMSLTRTALGTTSIPPNQVVIGLSMFLTFFVMGPTYEAINKNAVQPYMRHEITMEQAANAAQKPLRKFMLKNTYDKDLKLFLDIRKEKATPEDVSMLSLVPAFVISELKTAFIVGFYILVPFVIIDLVVASILMSLGMMMMPPSVVSLPAKLLVFILADGWSLLVQTILSGYR